MITQPGLTPPGGWQYQQPESKATFVTLSLSDLKAQIHNHRRANGYDLGTGWWEEVQMVMCLAPGMEAWCVPDTEVKPETPRQLQILDLLRFFRVMREWVVKHGFKRAEPEEVLRRAAICGSCPKNIEVPGCGSCQGVGRWLADFLKGAEEDASLSGLKNCEVCGCVLKLKVFLPQDVIDATTKPEETYPEACWVRPGE